MDDILCFNNKFDEHLKQLRLILSTLREKIDFRATLKRRNLRLTALNTKTKAKTSTGNNAACGETGYLNSACGRSTKRVLAGNSL